MICKPKYSSKSTSVIVKVVKLFRPVKMLSFEMRIQPVITANFRLLFRFSAYSNKLRSEIPFDRNTHFQMLLPMEHSTDQSEELLLIYNASLIIF